MDDSTLGGGPDEEFYDAEDTSLLIYYAGHGFYPVDEEEGYWIPKDAGSPETQKSFISSSSILGKVKALKTKHTLLIVKWRNFLAFTSDSLV